MHFVLKTIARNRTGIFHQAKLYNKATQKIQRYHRQKKQFSNSNQQSYLSNSGSPIFSKNSYSFVSIGVPYKSSQAFIDILQFLSAQQLQYSQGPTTYKIKYCPFCKKPHYDERTNLYTLNIYKQNGRYYCFRCGSKGSWLLFRERVLGFTQEMFQSLQKDENEDVNNRQAKLTDTQYFFYKSNLYKQQYKQVLEYLYSRGFKDQTIKKFNIGAGNQSFYDADGDKKQIKCVYFPNYKILKESQQKRLLLDEFKKSDSTTQNFFSNNNWSQIVKVKIRGSGKENKKYMRQMPSGGQRGFFGLNIVKDTDNTVILTQGEFDAMAVYQQTGIPALSLPQGATSLPQSIIPYLSRFQKIILWMDNDDAGILNTTKIADKTGVNRTYIVKHNIPKMKDANDFLLKDPSKIIELINKAKTIPDSSLLSFNSIREAIFAKISRTEQNNGVKISWLPYLNKTVKGIRMGELSIMSGPTGSGKTTFLSQLTLDLCKKDISVLWGSFQIRNQILITSMLYQFSDLKIDKNLSKFQYFADKFSSLPLHFMNFYGSHSIDKILSTIVYSIEKYNVHVVVIDTLQFLLSEQADGFKKFQLQDTLMARLREISIKFSVHVIIVIHPRKTEDNQDIGIHSIYGTSKATQQADNIWLIQNRQSFKIFEVKKNRYDGQLGRVPIGFNRNTKNFFQLNKDQFESLRSKEKTMSDIVAKRQIQKPLQKAQQKSDTDKQYQQEVFEDESIVDSDLNRTKKTPFKLANRQ